jgi:deoxyribodipyrimidine photo-lyase
MAMVAPLYVFIFRRDLRVPDNRGLLRCMQDAAAASARVLPLFIFSAKQIDPSQNPYAGTPAIQFLLESLAELLPLPALAGSLRFFHVDGQTATDIDVLKGINHGARQPIAAVYFNADITPFARARDAAIDAWCQDQGIACRGLHEDYTLLGHLDALQPYQVYGAFFKRYSGRQAVPKPGDGPSLTDVKAAFKGGKRTLLPYEIKAGKNGSSLFARYLPAGQRQWARRGGRTEGLKILAHIRSGHFRQYGQKRDLPALDATTHLSAYLKFGCISIRETYHAIRETHGADHALIRQLFWREFYDQLAVHFPRVLQGESLRTAYDAVPWENNRAWFEAWCEGRTGFPFVDAGMRQLVQTGDLHNRMRMVVASFLVKDLHVDWRWGERFFAQRLLDYSPTANNGGWTWVAGSGADAQPYYRIFNPWLQSKRFDADAVYIKRWVPELRDVPAKDLHAWHEKHAAYDGLMKAEGYPAPMVDHAKEAARGRKVVLDTLGVKKRESGAKK